MAKLSREKFSLMISIFYFGLIFSAVSVVLSQNVLAANYSDLNDRYELWLDTKVSVPVNFVAKGSNPSLDYLNINYSWIPENDYRQELASYTSKPTGEMNGDNLLINVNKMQNFNLEVDFSTYTNSAPVEVKNKVAFPLKGVDSSIMKYTIPSDKIDINDDIRRKASELASGEEDLYVVVFKLADWVNSNIAYNLSSTTVDASLPASWVFENKYGVCDELSNLFISMCRSLGIPARFVSGIAYSDDPQFQNAWGAHGWAEVYFPGYGWIPFDPTYDQLGYVDATHIKFDDKLEGSKNALEYTWLGKNLDVSSGQIGVQGNVLKKGDLVQDDFSIDLSFMKKNIGFGSYNVISASLQNKKNYYVAAKLSISRTEGLETIGEEKQDVLLLPNERKTIYWIIKAGEFDSNYIYTFPVTVYSSKEEASTKFQVEEGLTNINLRTAENFISSNQVYVAGPKIECTAEKQTVYQGEPVNIECTTDAVQSLRFCVEDKCTLEKSLVINKTINISQVGFSTIKISASNTMGGDSSYVFLSFNVLDEANTSMEITYPDKITFDERGNIKVSLKRESSNIPQNATLNISTELISEAWNLQNLDEDKNFILEFYGKNLKNGKNKVFVNLEYYDELGKKYSETKEIEIELYGLTFFQKIHVWLNGFLMTF